MWWCDDTVTLLFLADQACVTPHRWLSRTDRAAGPDHPDRLVFDLDPPDDDFATVRAAAAVLRTLLDELALPAAPMTTGSRGLHLVVPLDGRQGFDEVRRFAHDVAELAAARHPGPAHHRRPQGGPRRPPLSRRPVQRLRTDRRGPLRGPRPPGRPVAVPVAWSQLEDPVLHARRGTIADALERARTDPWAELPARGRGPGPARRRLAKLRD